MDILLENMPQMIPITLSPLAQLEEADPLELINEVYRSVTDRATSTFAQYIIGFSGVLTVSKALSSDLKCCEAFVISIRMTIYGGMFKARSRRRCMFSIISGPNLLPSLASFVL
jgi:hypothetical protein